MSFLLSPRRKYSLVNAVATLNESLPSLQLRRDDVLLRHLLPDEIQLLVVFPQLRLHARLLFAPLALRGYLQQR
jgi:hypothetical protein